MRATVSPCTFIGLSLFAAFAHAQAVPIWTESVASFLKTNCHGCHSGADAPGGLDLTKLGSNLGDAELLKRWVRIHDRVAAGEMPPKDAPRPAAAAQTAFLSSLAASLSAADKAQRQTVLRRLNRVEYENTIRDLFNIRVDVREMLPEDPTAHGFDNIGEALAISPEQLEVYLASADKALDQLFGGDREPKRVNVKKPMGLDEFASRSIPRLFQKTEDNAIIAFQGGWCPSVFNSGKATVDGTYRVRVQAKTFQTDKPLVMAIYGGDVIVGRLPSHLVGYYDVAPGDDWTVVEFEDFLEISGAYQFKPYNLNAPSQGPNQFVGPGLVIGEVEVVGPLEVWPPISRVTLLGDVNPAKAGGEEARQIFARLLPRAFRRPAKEGEVDEFVALTEAALAQGRSFIPALRVGLQALLCSPEFLFREEPAEGAAISQDALATRLSYFLWSSLPDDELLALAAAGKLREPEVLHQQVERLLKDAKGQRFTLNFTGQWLDLRDIDFTEPDMRQYPEFDEMLRYAMLQETHRFFREVLEKDLPLTDFVHSDWAILNERLAKHYGIAGVTGQQFRRVQLPPESPRGGVLTQAAVLKVTANGTNTSPVVRGVWVLENIMGRPVQPPPPGIGAIEPDIRGATTLREQLAKHKSLQSCAACHRSIDPPGFALESFDAIGGWRDWYRSVGEGKPVALEINRRRVPYKQGPNVDPSGELADGRKFANIREFKQLLLADKEQLARCLAEKLLTYGTGRGLGFSDRPAVAAIVAANAKQEYGFRSLIHEVVQSPTFQLK